MHAIALDGGRVMRGDVLPPVAAEVVAWVRGLGAPVRRVAVDAPSARSPLHHAGDETLAPKFRRARCGEIALGRDVGVWVPWVSPAEGEDLPAWIAVGLSTFAALAAAGFDAVETYPHAVFRTLAGGRVASKSTAAGRAERVRLLRAAGVAEVTLPLWDHDGLDACAAALVAADPSARALTCGHDGSAIWLPGTPTT